MKTLKIFVVLCFIVAFAVNTLKAQNGAVKEEFYIDLGGQYFDCTGDYLCGYVILEVIITKNNYLAFSKKTDVTGYFDSNGSIPSGNIYEFNQMGITPGLNGWETTGTVKQNGKIIAVFHGRGHVTIDANGRTTANIDTWWIDCK